MNLFADLAITELHSALGHAKRARDEIETKTDADAFRNELLEVFKDLEKLIDETHARYGYCELCGGYTPDGLLCRRCDDTRRYRFVGDRVA